MIRRLLLPFAVACLMCLVACGTEDSAPAKTMPISPALRATCPENPLQPKAAEKRADSPLSGYPVEMEIYDNDGVMVREMHFDYTPGQGPGSPQILWDMKDSNGRQVPSGYYFIKTTITIENGYSETQTRCVFVVNDQDRGKLE